MQRITINKSKQIHKTHMVKNITLSVNDEIAEQMNEYPEVNWSEVARQAIITYISHRNHKV